MTDKIEPHYQFSTKRGDDIYLVTWPAGADADEKAFMAKADSLKAEVMKKDLHEVHGAEPHTPKPAYYDPNTQTASKSFQVETIKLASGGEHPRWVAKGGNFKKFGVTVWPEVLEAAGLKDLDPLKENPVSVGWTAFYTERKNQEGKDVPDKITRLVDDSIPF